VKLPGCVASPQLPPDCHQPPRPLFKSVTRTLVRRSKGAPYSTPRSKSPLEQDKMNDLPTDLRTDLEFEVGNLREQVRVLQTLRMRFLSTFKGDHLPDSGHIRCDTLILLFASWKEMLKHTIRILWGMPICSYSSNDSGYTCRHI
jgi:hypothetical protein